MSLGPLGWVENNYHGKCPSLDSSEHLRVSVPLVSSWEMCDERKWEWRFPLGQLLELPNSVTPTGRLPLSSQSARSRVEVASQSLTGLASPEGVKQGLFHGYLLALAALRTILAFVSGYIGCHDLCCFCSCNVPTSFSSSSCSFLHPVPMFLLRSLVWLWINIFLP